MLAEKATTLRRTLGRSKGEALDPLDDSSLPREAKVYAIAALTQLAVPKDTCKAHVVSMQMFDLCYTLNLNSYARLHRQYEVLLPDLSKHARPVQPQARIAQW